MKKLLLASTAAFIAFGAAQAQAEIKLDLGGYFKGYAGYADQDTSNLTKFDIKRKSQVYFQGETTLDNGLTVGYHGELFQENTDGTDALEESYLYFSGNWGRVNLGRAYGAAYLLQVAAPAADSNVDGQDIDFSFINVTTAVDQDYQHNGPTSLSHYADKITYLTPKFNGFQAGVSYSPEFDQKLIGNNLAGMQADNTLSDLQDYMEGAVRYDGEFSGVGVHAGGGYSTADYEALAPAISGNSDNFSEWNAGLKLTFEGFGVGTAYNADNGDVVGGGDTDNWVVGADYTYGAYKFGASYFNSESSEVGTSDNELDRITIGAGYTFGPGMEFRGSVGYAEFDSPTAGADNEATFVTVGTDIQF